ncbi:MAG: FAD-dependent oxidoreductase [Roseburia sp.]|nr:FAD-dependent oxidoreductase [Roseburia sp.]
MESLWRKQTGKIEPKQSVNQFSIRESHWDVVVVGAGMAGILTAYFLQQKGKRVLVVEAKTIASGQTERTTAKITSQHGLKYAKLIKNVGEEKAKLYALANEQAIAQYARLVKEKGIDCQFERVNAYIYSTSQYLVLKEEAKAAERLGIHAEFTTETELPFEVKGAVRFENQAQFSPLEFVKKIAEELDVLEHTRVTEIKDHWVVTNKGILTADDIVVATHYPIRNVPGFYFLRQHQERSYVLALSGTKPIKNMYYGIDENGLSFRRAGEYLLLGGSGHRTGKAYGRNGQRNQECGGAYESLKKAAQQYFPEAVEMARWSAQDCMPHDGIPFIGLYSVFTPHLYVATGFQKWGMSTSMIAAKLLCDEICGKENPFKRVFAPQRMLIRAGAENFIKDVGSSVCGLIKGMFSKRKCSHMGCALTWNPDEHSWDCPCHGSRYDAHGKLLDNPAKKDI